MSCRTCGAELGAGAGACPACGTPAGGPVGPGDPGVAVAGGHEPGRTVTFRLARLSRGDRVVAVASLAVFVALFLPWYGTAFGVSADGLWHGWMYITLLLALATAAYLVALAAVDVQLPVVHWQALLGAAGVILLLVVLGVATTPTGASLQWGGIVGLLAAVAALVGALLRRAEAQGVHTGR